MSGLVPSREPAQSSPIGSFGVGCFHFRLRRDSQRYNAKEYLDLVAKYLGEVANVRNIKIDAPDHTYFREPTDIGADIAYDIGVAPWYIDGAIEFTIMIPERVQKDIVLEFRETCVEDIVVRIVYNANLPVAFVYGDKETEKIPSTLVMIVRKHLDTVLPFHEQLKFESLGPSPFHADFYLREGRKDFFEWERVERRGYDDIYIDVPTEVVKSGIEMGKMADITAEGIGYFYCVIQRRNRLSRDIAALLERLESVTERAPKWRWRALLIPPHDAADMLIEAERIGIEIAKLETSWTKQRREAESTNFPFLADASTEEEISDLKSFPLRSYRSIAEAIDSRRKARQGNRTVLVAAVVSAAVSLGVTWIQSAGNGAGNSSDGIEQTTLSE